MIQLYTWGTPNGKKVSIMLEEVGLPYEVHPINLQKGDQFASEYLAINPNNKIPSIIDTDGPGGQPLTLFESGAILMYLAEKTGKLFPQDMRKRYEVIQWLMLKFPTPSTVITKKHCGFTKFWISNSGRKNTSPANTPSPTSPHTLGSGGTRCIR